MKTHKIQAEVAALGTVIDALDPLEENKRLWVLQTAASRFSLTMNPAVSGGGNPPKGADNPLGPSTDKIAGGTEISPQSFIRAKNPTTDVQRIACLAYYLTKHRNTTRFKTKQLTDLNTEAKSPNFSNAAVAVNNARKEKYLTPAGGGEKQLTSPGEDLVEALPDQEKVKALHRTRKKRARKRK
jgi:hypothetical protein